ncbi:C39 family peptidase [Marinobacter zhejiangensis]|uniref:Peptidase C39 domain-containing protein n=1 Tax=Marinobacter zhejiangensis TaxID=488535 RepID=A0A1I4KYL7_9GAMM|nr:C39 family peptidase [Marinobacter zhejiangensis]SFL83828.1 hypothetical protein SAMN04487963_0161 [Marinobacter zhejiangensis]
MGRVFTAVLLAVVVLAGSTSHAGSVSIPGLGGDLQVNLTSFQERRFSAIIRQQYDYSCGSAALASLLSYHYEHPVTEAEVFSRMLSLADPAKVQQEGFSMLDMKRYLASEGYLADGFRMDLDGLRERVAIPVVVLLTRDSFRHFVIIKGISANEVLVGDPAKGMAIYDRQTFLESWDGIAFVIRNHLETGRASFRPRDQWPSIARAPIGRDSASGRMPVGHEMARWPAYLEW